MSVALVGGNRFRVFFDKHNIIFKIFPLPRVVNKLKIRQNGQKRKSANYGNQIYLFIGIFIQ